MKKERQLRDSAKPVLLLVLLLSPHCHGACRGLGQRGWRARGMQVQLCKLIVQVNMMTDCWEARPERM